MNNLNNAGSVSFQTGRNTNFNSEGVILFTSVFVNEGGAFDIDTAIFTAPYNGTYMFAFAFRAKWSTHVSIGYYKSTLKCVGYWIGLSKA